MKSFKQYLVESSGVKLGDGSIAQVGDAVSFKSDYEQTGTLVSVKRDMFNNLVLTLQSSDEEGFGGDYIEGEEYTQELAKHCWKEGGRFTEATRAPEQAADDEPDRRPHKTKEKDDWSDLDDLFAAKPDQPLSTRGNDPKPEQGANEPEGGHDPRRRASQSDTLRAAGNVHPTDRMRDMLSRMRDIEHNPDDAEYPVPDDTENQVRVDVNTANLPSIAGERLRAAGVTDPDFHQVANLPGNMSRAIRTLGKSLFRQFTRTPTEDIYMLGNLGGQGPNSTAEVNAVANWIRETGEDLSTGNIDFDTTIPGYNADIRQYSAAGIRWLMVRDEFGSYIYSWPESDSIQGGTQEIGNERPGQNRPRLGN